MDWPGPHADVCPLRTARAQIVDVVLAAYASGELATAVKGGHDGFKAWVNGVGKAQKRKGKRLFMPMRVALTGRMHGPDVGEQLELLAAEAGDVGPNAGYVPLAARMEALKAWSAAH